MLDVVAGCSTTDGVPGSAVAKLFQRDSKLGPERPVHFRQGAKSLRVLHPGLLQARVQVGSPGQR